MAQLRQDYQQFVQRDAVIVVIGPEKREAFAAYWRQEALPFIGLPDSFHTVARLFHQEVNVLKLGRMPALMVIDKQGVIRLEHHGHDMADIPPNQQILDLLDALNQPS